MVTICFPLNLDISFRTLGLGSFLHDVLFCYVRRQENSVVHRLARRATSDMFLIWMETVPFNIYL